MYEKYEEDPHAQKWSSIVDAQNKVIAWQKKAIRDRNARIIKLEGIISTLSTPFSQIKERIGQKEVGDIEQEFKRPTGRALLKGKKILVITVKNFMVLFRFVSR